MSNVEKRSIVQKTNAQIEILQRFYDSGMTSYGKDHTEARKMLLEAVQEANLTECQVKVCSYDKVCIMYLPLK